MASVTGSLFVLNFFRISGVVKNMDRQNCACIVTNRIFQLIGIQGEA